MNLRRGAAILCVLAGAVLLSLPGWARERKIIPVPPDFPVHLPDPSETVNAPCVLGNPGGVAAAAGLGDIYPTDDIFFVLMDPVASCGGCSTQVVTKAYITIGFQEACSLPVEVSVVKAFGSPCRVPDRFQIIYPPFPATVASAAPGFVEVPITFPTPCTFKGAAFIAIEFIAPNPACSTSTAKPLLALKSGCPVCQNYEYFASSVEDMCTGGGATPLIRVDADCVTPVTRRSWGSLKIHYR
jgi:hypothetical protein